MTLCRREQNCFSLLAGISRWNLWFVPPQTIWRFLPPPPPKRGSICLHQQITRKADFHNELCAHRSFNQMQGNSHRNYCWVLLQQVQPAISLSSPLDCLTKNMLHTLQWLPKEQTEGKKHTGSKADQELQVQVPPITSHLLYPGR